MVTKIIESVKKHQESLLILVAVVLITIISYNMGRMSAITALKTPITIHDPSIQALLDKPSNPIKSTAPERTRDPNTPVIASKASKTKYFYFEGCASYSRISEKNRVAFPNAPAAIAAGFIQAPSCK